MYNKNHIKPQVNSDLLVLEAKKIYSGKLKAMKNINNKKNDILVLTFYTTYFLQKVTFVYASTEKKYELISIKIK